MPSMNTIKKLIMALAALAALAVGGATIANATGSGSGKSANTAADSETNDDGADASLAGTPNGDKAAKAATDKLGGGKVVSVEKSDEDGGAVYEVKVDKAGTVTEVQVDKAFDVTAAKADDDQGDEHGDQGDGDGETNDD